MEDAEQRRIQAAVELLKRGDTPGERDAAKAALNRMGVAVPDSLPGETPKREVMANPSTSRERDLLNIFTGKKSK